MSRGSESAASFAWASSRIPLTPRVRIFEKSGVQFCEWRMEQDAKMTTVCMSRLFGSGPYNTNRVSSGNDLMKLVEKSLPAQ